MYVCTYKSEESHACIDGGAILIKQNCNLEKQNNAELYTTGLTNIDTKCEAATNRKLRLF